MEADFNAVNKIIYGCRMMGNVRKHDMMPDEIFSEKNRTADDGTLTKVLFFDVVRQSRRVAGISSVDADNCFDRVAHAVASLIFQAFGVSESTSAAMLRTIQEMQFFLRTAFGDSKSAAGIRIEIKTQGLCQGNGAAPAGWAVVSIVILRAHSTQGHGATFYCPLSGARSTLAAILYVDDSDVIHLRMDATESVEEVHLQLQDSVLSWGNLLIATGGSLKPAKCFYHLISFNWRSDGTWEYARNEGREDLQLWVPQTDDTVASVEHFGVAHASKTLGSMTAPSGAFGPAQERIAAKAQAWVDTAKNAKLSRQNLWFLVDRQFWPKVGFGIGTIAAPFEALTTCLHRQYYQLLSLGGIRRSVPLPVRYLGRGFFGSGYPHLGVEATISGLDKLLTHYGCDTVVGRKLQVSVEFLVMELGLSVQPFSLDYSAVHYLVTDCWLKFMWEKIWRFRLKLNLGNVECAPPRLGDDWLMRQFLDLEFSQKDLVRLNRVRLHQQVLFVSHVMDAGGKAIDRAYLSR